MPLLGLEKAVNAQEITVLVNIPNLYKISQSSDISQFPIKWNVSSHFCLLKLELCAHPTAGFDSRSPVAIYVFALANGIFSSTLF